VKVLVLDFSSEGVSPEHMGRFQSGLESNIKSKGGQVLIGQEAQEELRGSSISATAAEAIHHAGAALAKGKDLYENLMFDEAIRELTNASQALEDNLASLESLSPLEDAYVSLAMALQAVGEEEKAIAELRRVISLDAGKTLEKSSYPPSLISALETARKDVISSPTMSIFVETSPPLAFVYLDGKRKGTSPLTIRDIPPGAHLLAAEKIGFRRTAVKFEAGGGPADPSTQKGITIVLKSLEGEKSYEGLRALILGGALREDAEDQIGRKIPPIARSCEADYAIITALKPMMDSYQSLILLYDGREGRALHKEDFPLSPHPGEMEDALKKIAQKILPFLQPIKEGRGEISKELFPVRASKEKWYRNWKIWAPIGGTFLIASGLSFYAAQGAARSYSAQVDAYNQYITSPHPLDPAVLKSHKDKAEMYKDEFTQYTAWGYVTLGVSAIFFGASGYCAFSGDHQGTESSHTSSMNITIIPHDGGIHLTLRLLI